MTKARVTSRKRINTPAKPAPTAEDRRLAAYRTLGIEPKAVTETPQITHILKQLPDGISSAIEFLRGSDEPDARKWLSLYDDLPSTARDLLPFEAICLASNIKTQRMLELVTGACFLQTDAATKLLAAASHPKVVKATIKYAQRERGEGDRKMLHLHKGFVPVPKNQTTIISGHGKQTNLQLNDNSQTVTYAIGEINAIERRQGIIADRFNERLGLGPGSTPPRVLEAHVEPELHIDPDDDTSEPLGDDEWNRP